MSPCFLHSRQDAGLWSPSTPGWPQTAAIPFLRYGRLHFARHASPLVQDPSGWPRLLARMLFGVRPTASPWLDLAVGRRCLDRLSRNGGGATFFPWASPIPREARKSLRRHPPLCSGPRAGAAPIASGKRSSSRPRWSRGSKQQGEVTWLTSVPSRSPATSTRARS